MAAVNKYVLLIRLAQEKHDAAANEMGIAQKSLVAAQNKYKQVESFLDEYRQQRVSRGAHGMTVAQWLDFQRFLERLENALVAQQREVESFEQLCEECRQRWQAARQHLKALETLQESERRREQIKQMRREQKQTDELATRAFTRREQV